MSDSREEMRLQKYMSRAGVASRRESETIIEAGRVRVNGEVVRELGTRVRPDRDRVEVDGRELSLSAPIWIALHKPKGVVSTRKDPRGRRTVYDLLPHEHRGLFYVGRLDLLSEGLMLLTNQGDVAHRLLHPGYGVERVYEVLVEGDVTDTDLRRLREGVELEDGLARAERVERKPTRRESLSRVRLTLREGRNREVRRMFAALDHKLARLVRIRYGPVRLMGLDRGEWRVLERQEMEALRREAAPGGAKGPREPRRGRSRSGRSRADGHKR